MTAPAPVGPRIFVSHAHQDDSFCLRLIADLRERLGEDAVWYDTSGGLHGSDQWWDRIVAEITDRPYFLVVLSPSASDSKWVPEEMAIAYRQKVELGKRLLPVRLAESPRREDWKGIQEFNFTAHADPARYAAALAELVGALGVDPGRRAPHAPPAPEPNRPLSRVEQWARDANSAYGRQVWSDVLNKTDLLIERDAMTPDLWRKRVSAAGALRDARAKDAIAKALASDPDDVDTLLLLGHIFVKEDDDAQGAAAFERAHKLAPIDEIATRLTTLDALSASLRRLGNWASLLSATKDARRMAPDDPRWSRAERDALEGLDRKPDALALARALAARPDATAADALALARLARESGALDEASGALADAGQRSPGAPELAAERATLINQRVTLARALASGGKLKEAWPLLIGSDQSDPLLVAARAELFPPPAVPQCLASLGYRGGNVAGVQDVSPPMVTIPAGPFQMGENQEQHRVEVAAFQIGKYPVTVAEYALAVATKAVREPGGWTNQQQHPDHPVVNVSWQDAVAYIGWLVDATGLPGWRLPTEAEWEKAARWDPQRNASRVYPWGDTFDKDRCNTSESGIRTTSPVGSYPATDARRFGASAFGVEEMAGNVWEWTSSLYKPYQYTQSDGREDQQSTGKRTLRGGSWINGASDARAACRYDRRWDNFDNVSGFRLALSPGDDLSPAGQ